MECPFRPGRHYHHRARTLSLTLNPIASPEQAAQIPISGTAAGGTPPILVDWQTDQGYSGKAATGTGGTWSANGITLVTGANTLTVTAFDSAQKAASESAVVTRAAAAPVTSAAPLSIHISSPAAAVVTASSSTISLGGTASGGNGITGVTWQTSGGASGTAMGAGTWAASNVPLLVGTNTIIVRAYAAGGASAWASVIVDLN